MFHKNGMRAERDRVIQINNYNFQTSSGVVSDIVHMPEDIFFDCSIVGYLLPSFVSGFSSVASQSNAGMLHLAILMRNKVMAALKP